jgi:hypothetical protein
MESLRIWMRSRAPISNSCLCRRQNGIRNRSRHFRVGTSHESCPRPESVSKSKGITFRFDKSSTMYQRPIFACSLMFESASVRLQSGERVKQGSRVFAQSDRTTGSIFARNERCCRTCSRGVHGREYGTIKIWRDIDETTVWMTFACFIIPQPNGTSSQRTLAWIVKGCQHTQFIAVRGYRRYRARKVAGRRATISDIYGVGTAFEAVRPWPEMVRHNMVQWASGFPDTSKVRFGFSSSGRETSSPRLYNTCK